MSEKLNQSHEYDPEPKVHEKTPKEPAPHHEQEPAPKPHKSLEKLRHNAEQQAISSEKLKNEHLKKEETEKPLPAPDKNLKNHVLGLTLRRVRRTLPKPQQQFSKFIHNPVVEQVSATASQTVARPSGLLFGGIFSLLSGFGLLIACYYYGYTYNFLIALAFFAGGFAAGLVIEAVLRFIKR